MSDRDNKLRKALELLGRAHGEDEYEPSDTALLDEAETLLRKVVGSIEPEWSWKSGPMTLRDVVYEFERAQFCGCGLPEDAFAFVRAALACFDGTTSDVNPEGSTLCNRDKLRALIPEDGMYYFICYVFEANDWEEHGSTTPGWLTPRGEALRDALATVDLLEVSTQCIDYLTGELCTS